MDEVIDAAEAKAKARETLMAELRVKYPEPGFELVPLDLRVGFFVLRNPTHQEHMMYKKQLMDEGSQAVASHNLFMSTCVYPERAETQKALNRWSGITMHDKVQKAFRYLSGASDSLEGKG
jgi:hypothetical protein